MAPHCPHPTINPSDNLAPRRVSRASQGVGRAELIVSDLVPQRDRLATREGACDRLEQASVSGVGPEELKSVCLSFAGAREEFPFDEANSVFKVAGKIFALSRLNGASGTEHQTDVNGRGVRQELQIGLSRTSHSSRLSRWRVGVPRSRFRIARWPRCCIGMR